MRPQLSSEAAFAERFARKAQAMARLSHPHIVPVYEFGQRDALYFFIMEFMDGLNLRQLMAAGTIAPKEALAIVPQICEALQYAHDQGIVHRDIKPENILLNKQGQVKIADFGLAKLMGRTAEAEKVMGTPQYMAPEQIERPAEVDHRADIYSLGVVFYQMLTGELPVGQFAVPSKKVQVDVRLDEVVLKALEREPEKRYQQVSEVKTEVETLVSPTASGHVARPVPGWHRALSLVGTRNGVPVVNPSGVICQFLIMLATTMLGAHLKNMIAGTSADMMTIVGPLMLTCAFIGIATVLRFRRPANQLTPLDGPTEAHNRSYAARPQSSHKGLMGVSIDLELDRGRAKPPWALKIHRNLPLVVAQYGRPAIYWPGVVTASAIVLLSCLVGVWIIYLIFWSFARAWLPHPIFFALVPELLTLLALAWWVGKGFNVPLVQLTPVTEATVLRWRTLLVSLAIQAFALLLIYLLIRQPLAISPLTSPASANIAATTERTAAFGTTIETVIRVPEAPDWMWTDLDTGTLHSAADLPPGADINDDQAGWQWRLRNGAEAPAGANLGITAFGTIATRVSGQIWNAPAAEVQHILAAVLPPSQPFTASAKAPSTMISAAELPAVYLIQTRKGAGILEILEATSAPKGLRVRIRPLISAPSQSAAPEAVGSGTQSATDDGALVGRWESTDAVEGRKVAEFKADHTWYSLIEAPGQPAQENSGTWRREGSFVHFTDKAAPSDASPQLLRFEIADGKLFLQGPDGWFWLSKVAQPAGGPAVPGAQSSTAPPPGNGGGRASPNESGVVVTGAGGRVRMESGGVQIEADRISLEGNRGEISGQRGGDGTALRASP